MDDDVEGMREEEEAAREPEELEINIIRKLKNEI
jgi:hypothetical protein